MNRNLTISFLSVGILVGSMNAGAAATHPPIKSFVQAQTTIQMPGPFQAYPITGRQICHVAQVVTGIATFWQIFERALPKWISIPVYGSSLICTIIYN